MIRSCWLMCLKVFNPQVVRPREEARRVMQVAVGPATAVAVTASKGRHASPFVLHVKALTLDCYRIYIGTVTRPLYIKTDGS
jgi:hypothetical protein